MSENEQLETKREFAALASHYEEDHDLGWEAEPVLMSLVYGPWTR